MNSDNSLFAFKAICNFVNELENVYGKRQKSLKLYKRLVNQTQIAHETAINKHVSVFSSFCITNRDSLYAKEWKNFIVKRLQYSDRVFIDMEMIFKTETDTDIIDAIWKHLLTISAIVDPTGRAKEILRQTKESTNETDFLSNIISKVESNVKPGANPMEAMTSLMSSGMLNELFNDIGSKKLDLGKLLNTVQGMVSNLETQVGDDPQAKQAMGMLTNVMGGMSRGEQPDMSAMMQMMTTMMGNMQNSPVEDMTEKKI